MVGTMKTPLLLTTLFVFAACNAPGVGPVAGAIGFDDGDVSAFAAGSTGGRGPDATWAVVPDADAVSPGRVLRLTGFDHVDEDRFNLFWTRGVRFGDARIAVAVRADAGAIDQGGGPMWRVQDADNYYLCRFNPLESNFRLYVVLGGRRHQLATAKVEAGPGWHRLEAEHRGDRITCWFDGELLLEAQDARLAGPGGIGVWTKADARTSFDELLVQPKH